MDLRDLRIRETQLRVRRATDDARRRAHHHAARLQLRITRHQRVTQQSQHELVRARTFPLHHEAELGGAPEAVEDGQDAVPGRDGQAVDPGPLVGDHGLPVRPDPLQTGRGQPPVRLRTPVQHLQGRAEQPRDRRDGRDQRTPIRKAHSSKSFL